MFALAGIRNPISFWTFNISSKFFAFASSVSWEGLLTNQRKKIIKGTDIIIYRELTGGLYFGEKKLSKDKNTATDTCSYSRYEIERISHLAFKAAMNRKNKVTLVDKANVLESSRLWRKVVNDVSKKYPSVNLDFLFVDNAS